VKKASLSFFLRLLSTVVFFASVTVPVYAADRYVSDIMHIQLRRAPGNQQEIVANGLASGTALTFVREQMDSNRASWSLVKTAEGVEGWVRSQYLLSEPTAATQLPELQAQYQKVSYELEQLRQSSTRAIDIEQENQQLHANYQLLQTRADFLQAENDQLKDSDRYNQWVYGGGLLLCGVLLSFLLQAFGKRKRQSDWR
jgi:SH3 domain protein